MTQIVRSIHVTTKPELIRRFLLLDEGRPCSELRRAESERILRAQPFLADASVLAFPNDKGGVDLEVRTIDVLSISADRITAVQVVPDNLGLALQLGAVALAQHA